MPKRIYDIDNPEVLDKLCMQVKRMAGLGLYKNEVAHCLGITDHTLGNYIRLKPEIGEAYEDGLPCAVRDVANALFEKAVHEKDVQAMKFFLTNRAGDRYKNKQDTTQVNVEQPYEDWLASLEEPTENPLTEERENDQSSNEENHHQV